MKDNQKADAKDTLKSGVFLGRRIREIRKARGLSLEQLAKSCGLSVSYLSQTERTISTPSIKALHQISQALGAGISWFFSSREVSKQVSEEDGYVVRKNSRWEIHFNDKIRDEVLSPNLSRQIQMVLTHFEPGAFSGEPYSHDGEKSGLVITGVLELLVGKRKFLLGEGDSFAFDSFEPHRYGNPGDRETSVVWTITPPRI